MGAEPFTESWALVLPVSRAEVLAPLRLIDGLEVGVAGQSLWVRGRQRLGEHAVLLLSLPAERRYVWLADDSLRPHDSRLITGRLPSLAWESLRTWLKVTLPPAGAPASHVSKTALRLMATLQPADANGLMISALAWAHWINDAPLARINCLRFAADSAGRVLVLGTPLPSLPGRRMVARADVVVPLGHTWWPEVTPAVVREACGARAGAIVLWEETGIQVLGAELIVPASRAGARATAAEGSSL
jgi:hypothetical protein